MSLYLIFLSIRYVCIIKSSVRVRVCSVSPLATSLLSTLTAARGPLLMHKVHCRAGSYEVQWDTCERCTVHCHAHLIVACFEMLA